MSAPTLAQCHAKRDNNFHLLRLLAALAVIYGHAYPVVGSGGGDFYLRLVGNKFIGGVAVDIFFVISGLLIASSLERGSLRRFAWSRALRIFPALVVCTALCAFVLGPLVTTAPHYFGDEQAFRYFINNATNWRTEYFLPGVFAGNPDKAVNGSLWSLPAEFRLYCLFFLLGALGLMKKGRYAVVAIGLLLAGLAAYPRYPALQHYENWLSVGAFFLAGGFAWVHRDSLKLSIWGVVGVLAVCVMTKGSPAFGTAYFVALCYLVLYFAYVPELPRIRGRDISYGVYLYGWPVQQLLVHWMPGMHPLANAAGGMLLASVLGLLSWELVERPALKLKDRVA